MLHSFRSTSTKREEAVYVVLVILLTTSLLGLPLMRYAIYALPIIAFVIWVLIGNFRLHVNWHVAPLLFLLLLIPLNMYNADYNWAKKAYFVFAYTSVFILFDFRKANINVRVLNLVFCAVFLIFLFQRHALSLLQTDLQFSLVDSKSQFENTLAFPFGVFAVFFLVNRKYFMFLLNLLLAALSFKRIVILALGVTVIAFFLPKKLKILIVNPYTITAAVATTLLVFIEVARGAYDNLIISFFGVSTNQLLMGRQSLWVQALDAVRYDHHDFLVYGVGHGVVTSKLQHLYRGADILLHSDFLLILLEHGFIGVLLFCFLLNSQKSYAERYMTLFLSILFLTDNVLIYQHVMLPYLMIMAVLRTQEETDEE